MPIGLAASLFLIEPEAGLIPWIVTLLMLPYLLVISKVTRNWVANMTMIAVGFIIKFPSLMDPKLLLGGIICFVSGWSIEKYILK